MGMAIQLRWDFLRPEPTRFTRSSADLQMEIPRVLGAAWDARADAPTAADELATLNLKSRPPARADLQLEILRVLGAAWDARADAPCAADELREWAQYCGVSRSWRAYFGGRPLRLAFDAPLTKAQASSRSRLAPLCFWSISIASAYGTSFWSISVCCATCTAHDYFAVGDVPQPPSAAGFCALCCSDTHAGWCSRAGCRPRACPFGASPSSGWTARPSPCTAASTADATCDTTDCWTTPARPCRPCCACAWRCMTVPRHRVACFPAAILGAPPTLGFYTQAGPAAPGSSALPGIPSYIHTPCSVHTPARLPRTPLLWLSLVAVRAT